VARRVGPVGTAGAVDGGQAVEDSLHAVRQALVGLVLVGEHRVAAKFRHLARIEHRPQRRAFEITDVGVPAATEIAGLLGLLADFKDLGISRHRLDELMDLQLTEAAAEIELLLRGQMLVMKEDNEMLEQRRADLADHPIGEGTGEIDAGDLGAERAGDWLNRDCPPGHDALLREVGHSKPQKLSIPAQAGIHWPVASAVLRDGSRPAPG